MLTPNTEKQLNNATKEELTDALLSACQALAEQFRGWDMEVKGRYVSAGSLNNQLLKHLFEPDTIIEG